MTYTLEFNNWWYNQPIYKAYKDSTISGDLFSAMTKIAWSAWAARGKISEPKKASELSEQVRKIISEKLAVSEERVTLDAHIVNDLAADSLDQVELIMAFEDFYNIEIPDREAEKIQTVKDAINYLEIKNA